MKKLNYSHVLVGAFVLVAVMLMAATSNLTTDQIINRAFDADTGTLSLSLSTGTNKDSTAYTDAVTRPLAVQHETSGTPTTGIGVGIDFIQETSASNNETVARIDAVMTDTTAASEDASLVFSTMAAGAAAAAKLTMGSTGILTMPGGATLDNSTSATNLALAETNIGLTGAVTVTGDTILDGGLIVNEGSADKDVRIETNDVSDAFVVDGGANFVQIGTWAKYDYIKTTDQSYSLSSTGRASNIIQTVDGEDGTLHLMTALLTSPGAGAVITIKTGNTQTVTIDTEGSETIDGAATYTLDANYEAVTLTNDGSNWFVLSGYLE